MALEALVGDQIKCTLFDEIQPKGFARPFNVYTVEGFLEPSQRSDLKKLNHAREHVEVNILDSSDIPAAIRELKQIEEEISGRLGSTDPTE